MIKLLITSALAFCFISSAHAVFKCTVNGKVVFSDLQCAKEAETFQLHTAKPSEGAAVRGGILCAQSIHKFVTFKDPESVKLSSFNKTTSTTMMVNGVSIVVNVWIAQVNAKNSYGGYNGYKLVTCFTDISDTSVIDIDVAKD